jgi:phosphate transport system protein
MARRFETELRQLKERLVRMGSLAEKMVARAIESLTGRSAEPMEEVFETEEEVNELQLEIDERVIELIALRQPVASDLRLLVMATKISGELERIGDQAVNICQNTRVLLELPPAKPPMEIPVMALTVQEMVRHSLDAFVRGEIPPARRALDTDDTVDDYKDAIFRELLASLKADPAGAQRSLALILIARNLERVADHATNIAEEVIYLVQGRDVRHHHETRKRSENESGRP